jgi:sodium-dependent phosphate transporter
VLICFVFFIPYLHRRLVKEDWQLRWYHFFLGPILYRRGPVPPPPDGHPAQVVQNYYRGHKTREELEAEGIDRTVIDDIENRKETGQPASKDIIAKTSSSSDEATQATQPAAKSLEAYEAEDLPWYAKPHQGKWYTPVNLLAIVARAFMRGVDKDVVGSQLQKSRLAGNLQDMHARTPHYDNKTEHLYSFLQVLTAATASFAHGSNDVSNAMGPLSTIYLIWNTGKLSAKAPVPIWVL